MKYIKAHWKFLLFIIMSGIIGGISIAIYSIISINPKLLIKQVGSKEVLITITVIQSII